jgi:predicted outer membrane repeat protein
MQQASTHPRRLSPQAIAISVAAALCALAAGTPAYAEPDAGVVGAGTAASCTSAALQAALAGGGLVTFNCGPGNVTILSNTYVISANTEVDGGGKITLDGENLRQHFLVQPGATLKLRGITLTRGNAAGGGSIFNQGNTTIENAAFTANTASGDGGAILNSAAGVLTVSNVAFVQNKVPLATGYGGAISSQGQISITAAAFTLNEARYGGGMFAGGSGRASVNQTAFMANNAQLFGGGLYMNNDSNVVTVTHSTFANNTALSGAGLSRSSGGLTVQYSSFTNNAASTQGGGMTVSSIAGLVRVINSTFSGNDVADDKGGGIFNNGTLELVNVTLKNNTNGIFNSGAGESALLRNTVLDNPGTLNCDGDGTPVTSAGRNFSNDGSCALSGTGDQSGDGLDPKLGPLQTDFTSFHLPLAGSPLINAATDCTPRDQRYALRVGGCDIGAAEAGGLLDRARLPIAMRGS